jgi:hypothetical protein
MLGGLGSARAQPPEMSLSELKAERGRLEKHLQKAEENVIYWEGEVAANPKGLVAPIALRSAREAVAAYERDLKVVDQRISRLEAAGPAAPAADVTRLVRQLGDKDAAARRTAAEELGKLGPSASAALPALVAAVDDPDPEVQKAVRQALKQVVKGTEEGPRLAPPRQTGNALRFPDPKARPDDTLRRAGLEAQLEGLMAAEERLAQDIRSLEETLKELKEPKIDPLTEKPRQPMFTAIQGYTQTLEIARRTLGENQAEQKRIRAELSRLGGR